MVLPYHKGLIIKSHFILFLQQVVSEHFLGHKSGIFFFTFCRISRAASLQIRSVCFGSRFAKYDCRSVFFVKK